MIHLCTKQGAATDGCPTEASQELRVAMRPAGPCPPWPGSIQQCPAKKQGWDRGGDQGQPMALQLPGKATAMEQ